MATRISRPDYAAMYGPTTGDRLRLGDTDIIIEVEHDLTTYGEEVKFGGKVIRAKTIMHGKTSQVAHDESLIFTDVAQPFTATRYHSLAVVDSTVPADLVVTARTEKGKNSAGGVIMGLQHATKPIYGVQYHPESVLTEGGYLMLGNWLESLGLVGASERGKSLSPMVKL